MYVPKLTKHSTPSEMLEIALRNLHDTVAPLEDTDFTSILTSHGLPSTWEMGQEIPSTIRDRAALRADLLEEYSDWSPRHRAAVKWAYLAADALDALAAYAAASTIPDGKSGSGKGVAAFAEEVEELAETIRDFEWPYLPGTQAIRRGNLSQLVFDLQTLDASCAEIVVTIQTVLDQVTSLASPKKST